MKLCYLVLVHNNIKYVADLILSLSTDNIGFVVHVDSKCRESLRPLNELNGDYNVDVLKDREDIQWGDKSIVDIVNKMGKIALANHRKYDYFILLSGQDMPVKSSDYILKYLKSNGLKNYVVASPMLTKECLWLEQGRRRLECKAVRLGTRDIATIEPRCFNKGNLRQIAKTFIRGNGSAVYNMFKALFSKRRNGLDIKPFGGEFWWRLNRGSLSKILDYYDSHRDLEEELSYTSIPDEIIYNTLAYNLCDNIDKSILTYIKWNGANSPDYITMEDKDLVDSLIKRKNILYCRKVKDRDLLKYVQQNINRSH